MTREEKIKGLYSLKEYLLENPIEREGHKSLPITLIDYAIQALEQEPKTGHWKEFIHDAYHGTDEDGEPIWREVTVYHCSQCNRRTVIKEKFCPNCGTKMESEDGDATN